MQACTKTSLARWIKLPAVSNGKSLEKAEVAKLFVDPDGAESTSPEACFITPSLTWHFSEVKLDASNTSLPGNEKHSDFTRSNPYCMTTARLQKQQGKGRQISTAVKKWEGRNITKKLFWLEQ